MRKKFYNVSNSGNVGEIHIYGQIGYDWWSGADNGASAFVSDLKALESKYDRINVHINSPGGDMHEALPIIRAIKASTKDIHTFVDGIAYSAGAMIALAAKPGNAHIASTGMIMLHNALTGIYGNAMQLRDRAEILDKYDETLVTVVSERTGGSSEEVKAKFFDFKDHFFTAKEAKEAGLIDVIESYEAKEIPQNIDMRDVKALMKHFDSLNEQDQDSFFDRLKARFESWFQKEPITAQYTPSMDFKNALAILNADGTPTKEQLAQIKAEISAFVGANEKFTADEVKAKVEAAEKAKDAEIEALKAENKKLSENTPPPANPPRNGGDPELVNGKIVTETDKEAQEIYNRFHG